MVESSSPCSPSSTRTAACGGCIPDSYLGVPLHPRARLDHRRRRARARRPRSSPKTASSHDVARRRLRPRRADLRLHLHARERHALLRRHGRRRVLLERQRHRVAAAVRPGDGARDDAVPTSPRRSPGDAPATSATRARPTRARSRPTDAPTRSCAEIRRAAAVPDDDDRGRVRAGDVHGVRCVVPRLAVGLAAGVAALGLLGGVVLAAVGAPAAPARRARAGRRSSPSTRRRRRSTPSRAPCCSGSPRRRSRPRCSSRRWSAASGSSRASASFWGGTKLRRSWSIRRRPTATDGCCSTACSRDGVPGEEFEFGRTDTRFSSAAQKILKAATRSSATRGLRREVPAGARAWPILAAIGAAVLVFLFGFAALDAAVDPLVPILAHRRLGGRDVRRRARWSRASR